MWPAGAGAYASRGWGSNSGGCTLHRRSSARVSARPRRAGWGHGGDGAASGAAEHDVQGGEAQPARLSQGDGPALRAHWQAGARAAAWLEAPTRTTAAQESHGPRERQRRAAREPLPSARRCESFAAGEPQEGLAVRHRRGSAPGLGLAVESCRTVRSYAGSGVRVRVRVRVTARVRVSGTASGRLRPAREAWAVAATPRGLGLGVRVRG